MSDTSDVQLAYAVDSNPAAALGAGIAWDKINFVSHDFQPAAEGSESKVLRPDASVQDYRRTSDAFGGTLAMELARDAELEDLLAFALRGTWVSDVLKSGVAKNKVVFEEKIPLDAGGHNYFRYRGSVMGGFQLETSPDGQVDIRFPVQGITIESDNAITTTATYNDAGTAPVLYGIDFTAFTLTGFTTLDVETISIDMTNNPRTDRKLGSKAARDVALGKRTAEVEVVAYFKDKDAFDQFKADPTSAVEFHFIAPGGTSGFEFKFGRAKVMSYGTPIPGENQTLKTTLRFMATYNSTDGTDFLITRTA